ncbi:aspartate ammonia-lyase [Candidatus Peregrinibacteria bacterium]|nr:aspartate ammonia-lyase [Candidatus Peregrinibacteria bacterium]
MTSKFSYRIEEDSLGKVKIPSDAYFGSTTARAKQNFQISVLKSPQIFRYSLGIVKLACAKANIELGLIEKKYAQSLTQACLEFANGKIEEFSLGIFQAGAGTSYNMNANEVIANRANELLKSPKGKYLHVHPNNTVNMAQSTNDVIPTAVRIASILSVKKLTEEITELEKKLKLKIKKFGKIVKVGRTHLKDAVPITLGQEFDSYREAISKSKKFILEQTKNLRILGIGGTAVGTGINTDPNYRKLTIKHLSQILKIKFIPAKNMTEIANNMNAFLNLSSSLRSLAINLMNFMGDLKMMSMGPKAGINEINLPEIQPGSSIMPGKVNPSAPECLEMICFQVLGNDHAVELATQKSQFELNVMLPVIMHNLLQSLAILTNGIKMFREICLKGLTANKKIIEDLFEKSLCTGTALSPYLGYVKTAKLIKSALKNNRSIKEQAIKEKLFTKKELDEILSIKNLTQPSKINTKLIKKY